MGMVYLLSVISLAVVLFFVYWVLGFVGVPNHYSLGVIGFILVSIILTAVFPNLSSLYAASGEGVKPEGDRPLVFEKVDQPDAKFHRKSPQQLTDSKVFEVIPSENFKIATEHRVFDNEPLRTTIYQFSVAGQPDVFFANRRGEKFEQHAVMWRGEISGINDAKLLNIDGQRIQQAVKISDDRFVLAVNQPRENWKSQVLVVDGEGRILNTLYAGSDLHSRDRATEAWLYAGDKEADISVVRIDADEYLIPFSLGEKGAALIIGTRTKNYDSFFSAQGFYLPTQSQVFWFENSESTGVLSASFHISAGMPLAVVNIGDAFYLQTVDPRNRENPALHYYQLKWD